MVCVFYHFGILLAGFIICTYFNFVWKHKEFRMNITFSYFSVQTPLLLLIRNYVGSKHFLGMTFMTKQLGVKKQAQCLFSKINIAHSMWSNDIVGLRIASGLISIGNH